MVCRKLTGKLKLKKYSTAQPVRENMVKGSSEFIPKQVQGVKTSHIPPKKEWTKQNRQMQTPYGKFLLKYDELDKYIDSFNAQELCFYFREVAEENGYKYHLVFTKDGATMKRLMETYTSREICGMIEFLYTSEQDYLDKFNLSIGLLGSRWVNTIYRDFQLWLDDAYYPKSATNRQRQSKSREWNKESNSSVSSVGGWE